MLAGWNHRAGHYLLLLVIGAALFLNNLGGPSLWDVDEGRNAAAANAMLESGNWIVPTFNGVLRVDKPPLLYWLQATAYRCFGVSEFAARLPSALAGLLTVLLAYELGRRMFDPATGLLSGMIVASTVLFVAAARFANPDSLLNATLTLTFCLYWLAYPRPKWSGWVLTGMAAGLATLAKGPVGVLLPAAIIGLTILWNRRWSQLLNLGPWLGLLTTLVVALPWYVFVAIDTKSEFIRGFLMNHNVNRFLSPMESHRGTVFFYLVVFAIGFVPWSLFLGLTFWYAAVSAIEKPWQRCRDAWTRGRDQHAGADLQPVEPYRFLLCWIAVFFVFFSAAATKLPNYILPIYVPTAVLTARMLERWRRGFIQPPAWVLRLVPICLAGIGMVVMIGLALASGVVSLPVRGLRVVPELAVWAPLGLLPLLAAMLVWAALRRQRRGTLIIAFGLAAVSFVGPLAAWGIAAFNYHKAPRPLVETAGALQLEHDIRIGTWNLDHLPSLNFYVRRDVTQLMRKEDALNFLDFPLQVFLFLPADTWARLEPEIKPPCRVLGRHRDMYRNIDVVVVSNR